MDRVGQEMVGAHDEAELKIQAVYDAANEILGQMTVFASET